MDFQESTVVSGHNTHESFHSEERAIIYRRGILTRAPGMMEGENSTSGILASQEPIFRNEVTVITAVSNLAL